TLDRLEVTAGGDVRDAVASRVAEALAEGGCAAWICNTVDAAQLATLRLRRLKDGGQSVFRDTEIFLYHARFPAEERRDIEATIDRCFGKQGIRDGARPRRAVLIGTQVLEQALDYSVDIMVTE